MISRMRDQEGSVLVIAVLVTAMMVMVGLATFSLVDAQTRESGTERVRESSLNLNEGVIYAQGFAMASSNQWPGTAATAMPASCTSAAATTPKCPDRDTLAKASSSNASLANFVTADFNASSTWVTKVRDNGGDLAASYNPAKADDAQPGCSLTPCTYDANGDRQLWVQATTLVRGRPRAIVARLQRELLTESIPQTAVTAGHFATTNNGNHGGSLLLDGTGGSIGVRCDPAQSACASYQSGQVSPSPTQLPPSQRALMTAGQLSRLKDRAIQDGKYYPGCPPDDIRGTIVWVENCPYQKFTASTASNPCPPTLPSGFSMQNCINTDQSPGVLIWHHGALEISGNVTYIGLVYAVNGSDDGVSQSSDTVVTTQGGGGIWGAVAIDGSGGLDVGSNGFNVKYNANVFPQIQSYGTAGLVQNTWRELPPGS
jgi:Tfp pilus assembly protein PilX